MVAGFADYVVKIGGERFPGSILKEDIIDTAWSLHVARMKRGSAMVWVLVRPATKARHDEDMSTCGLLAMVTHDWESDPSSFCVSKRYIVYGTFRAPCR